MTQPVRTLAESVGPSVRRMTSAPGTAPSTVRITRNARLTGPGEPDRLVSMNGQLESALGFACLAGMVLGILLVLHALTRKNPPK